MKKRYLNDEITEDLKSKMVFIGGPRQVGKTTFSKIIGDNYYSKSEYLNWDRLIDRKKILKEEFSSEINLLILDEIHKYRNWKNLVKGIFDTQKDLFQILVTGSARLDVYRRGGDSLMGRYYYYRLHPFSVAELVENKWRGKILEKLEIDPDKKINHSIFQELFTLGGFPEPFTKQSEKELRRWQVQRLERLIRDDIRDLEDVKNLSILEVLVSMLPERAGSALSINSIREDLQLAHKTVESWIQILSNMYYIFTIPPYTGKNFRALKKERKLYLWDWSEIEDNGHRLENMLASHLLKFIHYLNDTSAVGAELYYLKDKEHREVDFLVTIKKKPWFTVEVKSNQTELSKNLLYFNEKIKPINSFQIVLKEKVDTFKNGVRIISADKFLASLI